jgi:hypothetical protein
LQSVLGHLSTKRLRAQGKKKRRGSEMVRGLKISARHGSKLTPVLSLSAVTFQMKWVLPEAVASFANCPKCL